MTSVSEKAPYGSEGRRSAAKALELPPAVHRISIISWLWLLAVAWLVFGTTANAAYLLAVVTGLSAMIIGLPLLMTTMGARHEPAKIPEGTLEDFVHRRVQIQSGPVSGRAALIQVLLIPLTLAAAMTGIGTVFAVVSASYGV